MEPVIIKGKLKNLSLKRIAELTMEILVAKDQKEFLSLAKGKYAEGALKEIEAFWGIVEHVTKDQDNGLKNVYKSTFWPIYLDSPKKKVNFKENTEMDVENKDKPKEEEKKDEKSIQELKLAKLKIKKLEDELTKKKSKRERDSNNSSLNSGESTQRVTQKWCRYGKNCNRNGCSFRHDTRESQKPNSKTTEESGLLNKIKQLLDANSYSATRDPKGQGLRSPVSLDQSDFVKSERRYSGSNQGQMVRGTKNQQRGSARGGSRGARGSPKY